MSTPNKKKYLPVTYCIALICILVGIFFPLGNLSTWSKDNLLFMMLPSALSIVLSTFGINFSFGNDMPEFDRSFTFYEGGVNFMAFAVVLLAIVAVIGILFLLPVLASKTESKAAGCAYFVEILAIIALGFYTLLSIYVHTYEGDGLDLGIIIALGGTALMLIIQTLVRNGGLGLMKLIIVILGAISVFAVLNVNTLISAIPASIDVGSGISVLFTDKFGGLDAIYGLFNGLLGGDTFDYISQLSGINGSSILTQITSIIIAATAIMIVLNFFIDIICLSTKSRRSTTIFNIIRYVIEAALAIASIGLVFGLSVDGFNPGLLMYAVLVAATLQIIISAIFAPYKKKQSKREKTPVKSDTVFDAVTSTETNVAAGAVLSPEAYAAPSPEAYAAPSPEAYAAPTPEAYAAPSPEAYAAPSPEAYAAPSPEAYAAPTPAAYANVSANPNTYANVNVSANPNTYANVNVSANPNTYANVNAGISADTGTLPVYQLILAPVSSNAPVPSTVYIPLPTAAHESASEPVTEPAAAFEPESEFIPEPELASESEFILEPEPELVPKKKKKKKRRFFFWWRKKHKDNDYDYDYDADADAYSDALNVDGYSVDEYNAESEVYNELTDAFIAKLDDYEKSEFSRLFIDKINGPYTNLPDYVIGGDNKQFFVSLFIHLGEYRMMIPDGLMYKIYNELNTLS